MVGEVIKHSKQRGFSLVEALISISISALLVLGLLGIVPYGFNETQINSTQVQAVAVGQRYLDLVRNAEQTNQPLPSATTAPVDQGNGFVSNAAATGNSLFTVSPNACPLINAGTSASQYDCAVTVTWQQGGAAESMTVETYVTR